MFFDSSGPGDLVFLTWRPDAPSPSSTVVEQAYGEMANALIRVGAVPLQERIFCEIDTVASILEGRDSSPAGLWPVPPTIIEGAPCEGSGLAGIHVVGVRPEDHADPEIVTYDGSPCGLQVTGSEAVYLGLSDVGRLLTADRERRPEEETDDVIRLTEEVLAARSWSFQDVRRTWFYLRDILDWYDEFNRTRNRAFDHMGLSRDSASSVLPASTGIFARNARGGWCVLDLLAVRSSNGRPIDVRRLFNPRQNEALEYGSAFSRGLVLTTRSCRYLLVSGTASIDDHGSSIGAGDFEGQTERTLDTVASLLEAGGAELIDIRQATAFVKRREDVTTLRQLLDRRGLDLLPLVCATGDICRDELLFELDATAVVPRHGD